VPHRFESMKRRLVLEVLTVRRLIVPVLIVYGLVVNPYDGQGGLPCLSRFFFGWECPGCGLSRANALLLRGWVVAAWQVNGLIVPVWFLALYAWLRHEPSLTSIRRWIHGKNKCL
jgi:hypothetical protein